LRKWYPNVHKKELHSELLDKKYRINITISALRCIDKFGGLDNYLLWMPHKKLASEFGSKLKKEILIGYEIKNGNKYNRRLVSLQKKGLLPASVTYIPPGFILGVSPDPTISPPKPVESTQSLSSLSTNPTGNPVLTSIPINALD
jgi:hypothetical protein